MSFIECVTNGNIEGLITKKQQKDLEDLYVDAQKKFLDQGFSENQATILAGKEAYESFEYKAINKKRHTAIQNKVNKKAEKYILETFKDNSGKINPPRALELVMGFLDTKSEKGIVYNNVETRIKYIRGLLDKEFDDALLTHSHNMLGSVRNKGTLDQVVDEFFVAGSSKNKAAAEVADAFHRAFERARIMANEAGASIPALKYRWLPQAHEPIRIGRTPMSEWIDFVTPLLAREKMINYQTGKTFSDLELKAALTEVYNGITTRGWYKRTSSGYAKSLANSKMDHRFIHFKDAQSWRLYHEEFGKGNLFETAVSHLDRMSMQIGTMQVMGPNPANFIRHASDLITRWANLQPAANKMKALDQARSKINSFENMYQYLQGSLNEPVSHFWAKFMSSFRELATSAYLGSASIMAFGDFNTTGLTSKVAGLPYWQAAASNMKVFVSPLGSKTANNTRIKLALQLGFTAEGMSMIASSLSRYSAKEVESTQITRRLSDFTVRTTALSWLTQAGRWGAGQHFTGSLANLSNKSFAQLTKYKKDGVIGAKYVELLKKYGISASEWDIIRKTKPFDAGEIDPKWSGALFLRADDIAARTDISSELAQELAYKVGHLVTEFQTNAVLGSSAKGATFIGGSAKPGTIKGEILRSIVQFKQFPLIFNFTHLAKGFYQKGIKGKIGYLGPLILATTVLGAWAHEMKNITKGKDVTDYEQMMSGKYILNAMLHGGGMGFAGDMLFGGRYSTDSTLGRVGEAAGPVAGLLAKVADLTFGNLYQALDPNKDMNLGSDIANFVRYNTPGGSNWYMRLLMERFIFDFIQEQIDPKYQSKWKRKIKRSILEQGNDYWWLPGDKTPEKAPTINPFK